MQSSEEAIERMTLRHSSVEGAGDEEHIYLGVMDVHVCDHSS